MAAPSGLPRPVIVLEGPSGCSDAVVAELRAAGHDVTDGLAIRGTAGLRAVRRGVVATPGDAAAAALAAMAGHGLVLESGADRVVIDRLIDDLRHLGLTVDHRTCLEPPGSPLAAEGRSILAFLAEGLTLGQASDALGIARRTADRRLAAARRALGTSRTTEAIARARSRGWLR